MADHASREFDDYHCAICHELFGNNGRTPRNLACGHTFCHDCIDGIKRTEADSDFSITCPNCRRSHTYFGDDELPVNFIVKGMAESFASRKQCEQCRGFEAETRILVCTTDEMQIICSGCAFAHHRTHDMITFQEYAVIKLRKDSREEIASMRESMAAAKLNIGRKIEMFRNIMERLESQWAAQDLPDYLSTQVESIASEEDANGVRSLAASLRSTFLGNLNQFSSVLDAAITEGRAQCHADDGSSDSDD